MWSIVFIVVLLHLMLVYFIFWFFHALYFVVFLFLQVFYSTVINEMDHLIAQWMSVGFAHGKNPNPAEHLIRQSSIYWYPLCVITIGVCSTDNFSLLTVWLRGVIEPQCVYDDACISWFKQLTALPVLVWCQRKPWRCRFCSQHVWWWGAIPPWSSGQRWTLQPGEALGSSESRAFWKAAERGRRRR